MVIDLRDWYKSVNLYFHMPFPLILRALYPSEPGPSTINSLFCVSFLVENVEESTQEKSESRVIASLGHSCDNGQSMA